jgi:hypothetical protein
MNSCLFLSQISFNFFTFSFFTFSEIWFGNFEAGIVSQTLCLENGKI